MARRPAHWCANFQFKRSKLKVTGRHKLQENVSRMSRVIAACDLFLSTPETLGSWTDGSISCRHSAPTSVVDCVHAGSALSQISRASSSPIRAALRFPAA